MDDKWFKLKQKERGITAEEIAQALGRDRSAVSRIYTGRQPMKLDEARIFSEILDAPLPEILEKAGLDAAGDLATIARRPRGFSESEAMPYSPKPSEAQHFKSVAAALGGDRPGIDVWQIKGGSLALRGFIPGDLVLVDSRRPELAKAGDAVVAQVYERHQGNAKTVFRLFEPPFLLSVDPMMSDAKPLIVDRENVVIRGRVVASWRTSS
ncbi:MAG: helix-turn-helix domain-containing protein [Pseudomonadota bacterium]